MLHLASLLFVVLKVLGFISWSWWLVFLPSIIALVLGLLITLGAFICVAKG